MSISQEAGVSCDVNGESNSEFSSPSNRTLAYHTGESVLSLWPEVSSLLQKAAVWGHGEYQVEDVLAKLLVGQMQLWVFSENGKIQLVGVTEIITRPRKKACNIYALAGYNMSGYWKQFASSLFTWMKENQIQDLETYCRDEVMEKLLPFGFQKKTNVLQFKWKEPS